SCRGHPRGLRSFPTRRSSDLGAHGVGLVLPAALSADPRGSLWRLEDAADRWLWLPLDRDAHFSEGALEPGVREVVSGPRGCGLVVGQLAVAASAQEAADRTGPVRVVVLDARLPIDQ